jgi:hypothetical protein
MRSDSQRSMSMATKATTIISSCRS